MADFKLDYEALTFPSGKVETHQLIVTNAPDKAHVVTMFDTIMNADTSKLHSVIEVTNTADLFDIRTVNFPKSML